MRRLRWPQVVGALLALTVCVIALSRVTRYYSSESCFERGRVAIELSDDEAVQREANRLIQRPDAAAKGHLLRGLWLLRRKKPADALSELERARSPATNIEAGAAAAQCFYISGRFLEAIDAAQSTLALDDHCVDARRWLAAAYYDLGAISNAVTELERLSVDLPTDPRPERLLGLIAKDSENYGKAIEYYRESLKRDARQADAAEITAELAESLNKLGQCAEALAATDSSPKSTAILTVRAEAKIGLGELNEAEQMLKEAIALDARYVPARFALGKLLLNREQLGAARKELETAVELDPTNRIARFQLSQAYRAAGDTVRADAELKRMEEFAKIQREFTDLHDVAAKNPESIEVRYRLAELARQLGKLQLSKMWLRAAKSLEGAEPKPNAAPHSVDALRQ